MPFGIYDASKLEELDVAFEGRVGGRHVEPLGASVGLGL